VEQIKIQELQEGRSIIDLLFHAGVRTTLPLLDTDNFKHSFQRHSYLPVLEVFVMRLDKAAEPRPKDYKIHGFEKTRFL